MQMCCKCQAVRALAKAGKAFSYTGPAYRGIKVAKSPLLKRKYETSAQLLFEQSVRTMGIGMSYLLKPEELH